MSEVSASDSSSPSVRRRPLIIVTIAPVLVLGIAGVLWALISAPVPDRDLFKSGTDIVAHRTGWLHLPVVEDGKQTQTTCWYGANAEAKVLGHDRDFGTYVEITSVENDKSLCAPGTKGFFFDFNGDDWKEVRAAREEADAKAKAMSEAAKRIDDATR